MLGVQGSGLRKGAKFHLQVSEEMREGWGHRGMSEQSQRGVANGQENRNPGACMEGNLGESIGQAMR